MSDSRPLAVPASRIARLTRLGSLTAGVAGNMAVGGLAELRKGKRPALRDLLMTPRNIGKIADELAKMRGAAMKIGQLMSMDTGDILPPELAQVMARLRSDAHFMPPAQLKKVLNDNWPAKWLAAFKQFDVRPIAAASIGQVHRAVLKDGREVAIKVQYPGVAQSIDSDVANVGALLRMSGMLPKGFDIAPYLEAAREQLHEETDYMREGKCMHAFGEILASDDRFAVPQLIPEWTTDAILAMTYLKGVPIEDLKDASQELRNQVAHDLIDLLLKELFTFGQMQTDPNFANYRYDYDTSRIVLLDFGATRTINPDVIANYRALMAAGLALETDRIDDIARKIGFYDETADPTHQDIILQMIVKVFGAIKDGFDCSDTQLAKELQSEGMILGEEGFVPPPLAVDILYLHRKFGGIFLLAAQLRATVDLRSMIMKHL